MVNILTAEEQLEHLFKKIPLSCNVSHMELPLMNSSFKNLNPWGIPASKTWTPEEFQLQKPEPLSEEFQPQGSKTWTPEEFQLEKPE